MPCKHSRKNKLFREGKVRAAKIEMQRFRDILNANPNRKGPRTANAESEVIMPARYPGRGLLWNIKILRDDRHRDPESDRPTPTLHVRHSRKKRR